MKNFLKIAAFASLFAVVSCAKDANTTDDVAGEAAAFNQSTDFQLGSNELLAASNSLEADNTLATTIFANERRGGGGRGFGGFGRGNRGNHPNGSRADSVGYNDLPAAVQAYLQANVRVDSIRRIVKITLRDSSVIYGIRLPNRVHVFLKADGTVVTMPTRNIQFAATTFDSLPAAAQTYLTNRGVTATTAVSVLKLTLNNGAIQYAVRVSNGDHYLFNAAGGIIRRR
ncbi:MAG: hypothetical protein RL757_2988 [Bacteroidota bacterium]|jgi:hypothetical protein